MTTYNFRGIQVKNVTWDEVLDFKTYLPDRVNPVEDGVCFTYRNGDEILYFEFYNDKEMGYIIENKKKKKIIENKNVTTTEEMINVLRKFYGK
jgi:hypothetical protein